MISDGSFRFIYNGDTYQAEPHSWISHRIVEKKALCGTLFLCTFHVQKNQRIESSSGDISPSQYTARIDCGIPTVIAITSKSGTFSEHFEKLIAKRPSLPIYNE
ncbi:hypothetical protein X798_08032 [Onchocerca flexuosa]|uniref:Uncharacterized protein n=1 Tax=Onchocerca flexuosa TaxID=387005 RepID=A0A238BJE7_9BILA|nr:hypothetical protein X798_08032 [Onchocerca flexuosa]